MKVTTAAERSLLVVVLVGRVRPEAVSVPIERGICLAWIFECIILCLLCGIVVIIPLPTHVIIVRSPSLVVRPPCLLLTLIVFVFIVFIIFLFLLLCVLLIVLCRPLWLWLSVSVCPIPR